MSDSYKLVTLISLCIASADVIKEKILPPLNPPNVEVNIPLDTIKELSQKPVFQETEPTIRVESNNRRLLRIPPEIDAHAEIYKGNLSVLVLDPEGNPLGNARVDLFSITAKIRRPRFVGGGEDTPLPPYPDVVAKRVDTWYTGADGRLECDLSNGNYMLAIIKDNLGGRSDSFVVGDPKEFTIKTIKF